MVIRVKRQRAHLMDLSSLTFRELMGDIIPF